MTGLQWTVEDRYDDWHFRAGWSVAGNGAMAECRRGPFVTPMGLSEPITDDVWFDFAPTPEAAIQKLRAEVLTWH